MSERKTRACSTAGAPAYAELRAASNFSFLRAASHPEELVAKAKSLGLAALGVADRNSLAGVVRAHLAAKNLGLRLLVGARLVPDDGPEVLCYPRSRAAYGRLCRLLTDGKRRSLKGQCSFSFEELVAHGEDQVLIVLPEEHPGRLAPDCAFAARAAHLASAFPGSCYLAGQNLLRGEDEARLDRLNDLATSIGAPLLATNEAVMHASDRKALLDVVTCIRNHCTIDEAGFLLDANGERRLKAPSEMARLFRKYPEALSRSLEIVEACRFSLDELRYEYPEELTSGGRSPQEELEHLTWRGAAARFPGTLPEKIRETISHELALIGQLSYAPYFLTVYDIVRFAQGRGILCQGRGSAANSAVCYCLGITAVDPSRLDLLFERFISSERNEPPDIDVDFEHERREEVIQYIYAKYGRERAGLAATVITYRSRSAIREVGKALGLSEDLVSGLSGTIWGQSSRGVDETQLKELGLKGETPRLRLALDLTHELIGFPRHLSQHVGGFVMSRGPLCEVVPIENAAMADRTVIEWDKDDLDALGILKVDVLALGMLTCLRKGFDLLARHRGRRHDLASLPVEDKAVYDMLCRGDSIGVFQVESRAQMSMLPRLKPRDFYDLVIEVAIVRPGPIQGDMVHPYLRRRNGEERVSYPSEALREVLGKTLGVPLFQEQAMKIAIVAAGFTASEADQLRRAMATFRRSGTIHSFHEKLVEGMVARGYERDFSERCFQQIEGFGEYGFPESHAASFALLVYASAWLKCHHPGVFAAALLNSQPMGFYAPAQIIRDARDHGVDVRPLDVNYSEWDTTLEPSDGKDGLALRLGLRQVKGLSQEQAQALVAARGNGYREMTALWRRAGLGSGALEALARADAFQSLGLDRRAALWAIKGLPAAQRPKAKALTALPLFAAAACEDFGEDPAVSLELLSQAEEVVEDYASLRFSLRAHPLSFLRAGFAADFADRGMVEISQLLELPDGSDLTLAGLVLLRQRPGTAKGVIFATLEDETGAANIIVWPDVFARYRRVVLASRLLAVEGRLQREGLVIHVVARRLYDLSHRLATLGTACGPARPGRRLYPSRDFH